MKKIQYFLWALLLTMLYACDTGRVELDDMLYGADYFPLEPGRYVSYNVRETNYRLNGPQQGETSVYQLKDSITETFNDLAFGLSYRMERYRRENRFDNWRLIRVWTARRSNQSVIRTEENIPYVKLVFPIEEGKRWNGNTFNDFPAEQYEMKDLSKSFSFAGKTFSQTATVVQSADSSLVERDIRREIYAKDVGMIYKKFEQIIYLQDDDFGKNKIERGTILEMSVFDFGKKQ